MPYFNCGYIENAMTRRQNLTIYYIFFARLTAIFVKMKPQQYAKP